MLIILGCGGHAKSVADVALSCGYSELVFVDGNAKKNESILGFPVISPLDFDFSNTYEYFPAIGNNNERYKLYRKLVDSSFTIASIVSPVSTIGRNAKISEGVFVGHHAHIGVSATVSPCSIVNSGAIIEHDVSVGMASHISVNATVAGRSIVGCFCFVGAGAVIIDGISLADNVIVGAGGCVVKNINNPGVYIGVPAKLI